MVENTDLKTAERKMRANNCLNFKLDGLHLGQRECAHQNIILHWILIKILFLWLLSECYMCKNLCLSCHTVWMPGAQYECTVGHQTADKTLLKASGHKFPFCWDQPLNVRPNYEGRDILTENWFCPCCSVSQTRKTTLFLITKCVFSALVAVQWLKLLSPCL